MKKRKYWKGVVFTVGALLIFSAVSRIMRNQQQYESMQANTESEEQYIKWVEFGVPYEALDAAYQLDVKTEKEQVHLNWVELLAYLGAKYGGDFSGYKQAHMTELAEKLVSGETTMQDTVKDMKYYSYYREAYGAVLDGWVGEYQIEQEGENGEKEWAKVYGLKAFSPIARDFPYQDYDDFGASRSYGYRRNHLGHDLLGQVGTPVIAVESGYVEALGWNQYGGWRIGIRSFDGKRYYYYAHLRQNIPYAEDLEEGSVVQAGDVIGYLGRTGYSATENVNNIDSYHLHFGIQLIFDESQKEGNNEIWIDCYQLVRFLYKNRSAVQRNDETKMWTRIYQIKDPAVNDYLIAKEQK
ncbi:M23 family metallopeptidase [Ruminococcus sp. OA3]|uniref:M23 family metallopeptidase n=1 Tax=Ruminococcus sp. OA3 TaxID=2914164 RepID=UPI001F0693BC|nr:M23 family metallopeptidase [Ruminococcus sp. OA3]MCH1981143.1 M23 family metallopeptidase [Ruminococcus sp. OA3]